MSRPICCINIKVMPEIQVAMKSFKGKFEK